jgi:hypothetical protein
VVNRLTNDAWGKSFGYRGAIDVDWSHVDPRAAPAALKPVRLERRE